MSPNNFPDLRSSHLLKSWATGLSSMYRMKTKKNDRISEQAYGRAHWSGAILVRFEKFLSAADPGLVERLQPLYEWFLCPPVLWPCNLQEVLESTLPKLERQNEIDANLSLFLKMLPAIPNRVTRDVVTLHEHLVQTGEYEHLLNGSAAKHKDTEEALLQNSEYQADWGELQSMFDSKKLASSNGVIRRSLVQERNFRTEVFESEWKKKSDRFQMIFDTFCAKWNLYGVQNARPLLQKLSVNLTPNGTLIFIPAYWSLDAKRDINWKAVRKLHNARVPRRQGPALAAAAKQRRIDAEKLKQLECNANKQGLRGARRHIYFC
jgi:hypothetical protein